MRRSRRAFKKRSCGWARSYFHAAAVVLSATRLMRRHEGKEPLMPRKFKVGDDVVADRGIHKNECGCVTAQMLRVDFENGVFGVFYLDELTRLVPLKKTTRKAK